MSPQTPSRGVISLAFTFESPALLGLLARRFGVCLHQPNACQDPARPLQTKPPPAPLQEFWSQGLDPSNQPALPRRWKHRNLLRSALSLRNKTAQSSQTAPKHLALPGCASPARESPRHSAGVLRGPWVWGHNGREQGSRAAAGPWGHSTSARYRGPLPLPPALFGPPMQCLQPPPRRGPSLVTAAGVTQH